MNKKYIQVAVSSIVGLLLICGCTQTSQNAKDSPTESKQEAVDTLHILQVGEKAVDAELFDMQGNKHCLYEALPMDVMCCSTSGISAVVLADSQSLSCWKSMTE